MLKALLAVNCIANPAVAVGVKVSVPPVAVWTAAAMASSVVADCAVVPTVSSPVPKVNSPPTPWPSTSTPLPNPAWPDAASIRPGSAATAFCTRPGVIVSSPA